MKSRTRILSCFVTLLAIGMIGCGGKSQRPAATTSAPPPARPQAPTPAPAVETTTDTVEVVDTGDETLSVLSDPYGPILDAPLDEINQPGNTPFVDVHFDFDSAALSMEARAILDRHAEALARYDTVALLIAGHCDERGTVEYNLALGERRANAVQSYLVSLGVSAGRLRTISYGKEFPLDPGHNEAAWAANRRGQFEITSR